MTVTMPYNRPLALPRVPSQTRGSKEVVLCDYSNAGRGSRSWRAVAARGTPPLTDPRIRHIIVGMLENRSFDHMLGLLMRAIPGLRGVNPGAYFNAGADGTRFYVTDGAAYQGQFPVDPPHEFEHVHEQLGAFVSGVPAMDGFARSYQRAGGNPANVMRCFRPEQLPALTALAKHYVVCDNWFASVPGPTTPNRQFAHFGTSVVFQMCTLVLPPFMTWSV
jgi:phospholipase C